VRVAAEVIGAGGEVYERFYQGKEMDRLKAIKPPRFEVVGERGWRIGGGKLDVREDQFYTQNWKVPSSYEGQRLTVKVEFDLGPLGPDGKPLKSEPVEVQYTGTKP
jgi:hypothetical protein